MNSPSGIHFLHRLSRLYGVQTAYYDAFHHRHQPSVEALLAALRSLGAPLATLQDVPSAWRERRQALWRRSLEPVVVAWNGEPLQMKIRLPASVAATRLGGYLTLESGERQRREWRGADLPAVEVAEIEGKQYVVKELPFSEDLPYGYHRFTLELPGRCEETLIISAPLKAYAPAGNQGKQTWGVFLPLYALHTGKSWGGGDFSDLEALTTWSAMMGGQVVATLPLLPAFLDECYEPSPYLPLSRLLWNEFYLDITMIPELQKCSSAQALLSSFSFQDKIKSLRSSPLVDYHQQMRLKRRILEELCRQLFAESSDRLEALHRFAEANPQVEEYARFRATGEKHGISWRLWPQPLREGILTEGDYNEESRRYHLWAQWLAHQQVQALSEGVREKGLRLYLDLPLGVHPDGYDIWRERSAFAPDVSAGAPPDAVFGRGQNWTFPPLHPERVREQGYQYPIAYLRHHLQHAGILRIDHVMGLHRLFWIPEGFDASQGVYVRYHAEELYAILALESHRSKAIIVGEDLGTVPPEVRPAMSRHGLHRMYVVQYELEASRRTALRPVSRNSIASLNTHDMSPFSAFWQSMDIEERLRLGLLDKAEVRMERKKRRVIKEALITFLEERGWINKHPANAPAVFKACFAFLSASRARVVLVNLEDLWLETQPQNLPSTKEEYPNWRRKARYSLEEFCQMPRLLDTLQMIDRLRKRDRY